MTQGHIGMSRKEVKDAFVAAFKQIEARDRSIAEQAAHGESPSLVIPGYEELLDTTVTLRDLVQYMEAALAVVARNNLHLAQDLGIAPQ